MTSNDNQWGSDRHDSSDEDTKEFSDSNAAVKWSLNQTQPSERFDTPSGTDSSLSRPKIRGGFKTAVEVSSPVDGYLPRRRVDTATQFNAASDSPADYRIIGKLGRGGTAVVYQAQQRAVDREVALKYLRPELSDNANIRRRFLHEARVIGSLEHPNIIAIHEVALDCRDQVFYSMKRIIGSPWNEQIDSLELSRNVDILLAIADAVRYAHSQQVIHRDLKPENVMLGQFGEILVADWGMAVRRDPSSTAMKNQPTVMAPEPFTNDSATGGSSPTTDSDSSVPMNRWLGYALDQAPETIVGGTPAYMAPEMTVNDPSRINELTDVYLLGAILYRIVTGRPPHHGETLAECIRAAADNLIVPTEIEHDLVDIARRAMNTHQNDRQADVETFIQDIRIHRRQQQSMSLVRRVKRSLAEIAKDSTDHDSRPTIEKLSFLDSLLDEAMEEWPQNPAVPEIRLQLGRHRAGAIADAGDIESALVLLADLGEIDGEIVDDLNRRRSAQCKQKRAVSRYSALFVQSPDPGLLVTMPESFVVEVNERFQDWFGFERQEVIGKTIAQLKLWVCPERRLVLAESIQQYGLINDFEAQLFRRDGEIIDVLIAGRRVELEGRQMMVATLRDISARKLAEADLRRSRDRMRNLQRMAGLATWSYRIADDTIQWSEGLFALFGLDPDHGTPTREEFYQLVHPNDRPRLRGAVDAARKEAKPYEIRIEQKSPSGGYQTVTIRGEPLRNASGVVDEIYGVSIPDRI